MLIDDHCLTSDPDIYAIGECAAWQGRFFGLVAPGYKMAQITVDHLLGGDSRFEGADMSAKLKLLGVSVGSIGDAHYRTPGSHSYVFQDDQAGVYKKIVVSEDNSRLLGAVLVGDVEDYGNLLQMMLNALPLPSHPDTLILPAYAGAKPTLGWMPCQRAPRSAPASTSPRVTSPRRWPRVTPPWPPSSSTPRPVPAVAAACRSSARCSTPSW